MPWPCWDKKWICWDEATPFPFLILYSCSYLKEMHSQEPEGCYRPAEDSACRKAAFVCHGGAGTISVRGWFVMTRRVSCSYLTFLTLKGQDQNIFFLCLGRYTNTCPTYVLHKFHMYPIIYKNDQIYFFPKQCLKLIFHSYRGWLEFFFCCCLIVGGFSNLLMGIIKNIFWLINLGRYELVFLNI